MIFSANPKISIISPSFNQAMFIEDAIRSVLNQNYENFEHIIVDGGSTDDTIQILNKYSHLKWVSEKDKGQSDALNKGFKMATGDIIGWLNTDDYYLPDTFIKVVNELTKDNVDAIYSNTRFVNAEGKIIREIISQKPVRWMSLFYCFIPSETFFFKREILNNGISIDENIHIAMDKEFFANILYSGYKLHKSDSFFAHFRWHGENKSTDSKNVRKIRYEESMRIFNRYSNVKLPKNKFGILIYKKLVLACGIYRTITRVFKIGPYS